jgi:hypothetical protein
MNNLSLPRPLNQPAAQPLPTWEQWPQERRRELTATLAALILKQLPPSATTTKETGHEQ